MTDDIHDADPPEDLPDGQGSVEYMVDYGDVALKTYGEPDEPDTEGTEG